jgi:PAS domain S-box-containing protein
MTLFGSYDPSGNLLGVTSTLRDNTERKRAEREKALLAAIVESSDDAILSISLDHRMMTWNKGAQKLFGFTALEAIGQNPLDLYVRLEDRELVIASITEDLTNLRSDPAFVRHMEIPCRRKDGSFIDVALVVFGIHDVHGKLVGLSLIIRDVTDRKRAQREVVELATIVNSTSDAIVGFSRDYKVTSWNRGAERAFGIYASAAVGSGFDLFVPVDVLPRLIAAQKHIFETGQDVTIEVAWPRQDGSLRIWSVTFFPLRDLSEKIVAGGSIGHDITEPKRAEREQGLLAALVKSSDDGIISVAPDARISSWNVGAERLFGYTPEEAIGRNLADLLVPSGLRERARAGIQEKFASAAEGHSLTVHHPEVPALRKDGSTVEVTVSVSGIYDSDGKLLGASSIIRDITGQKRAQREQALLAAIVAASDDAIISYSTDLIVATWNHGAEKMLGFTMADAVGKSILDLFVPPEVHETLRALVRKDLEAPTQTRVIQRLEAPLLRKDGSRIDAALAVSGIYDHGGHLIGLSNIMSDITERKQIDRENALLAAVVASSTDAIVSYSSDLLISSWNPGAEKMFDFAANEAIGKSILDVYVPARRREHARTVMSELFEAVANKPKASQRLEVPVVRKDGVEIEASIAVSGIYDRAGVLIGLSSIITDISVRKRMESELIAAREAALAASHAKSEFLSRMSHEIRTPMTSILGMADLLAEGQLNAEQRRYLEILSNNSHSLLDLINSILDLAKVESGRLTLEHLAFDLNEIVEKSAQTLAFRAHAKQVDLIVSIAPDVPTALMGDPMRLRQVLVNLIGNAIKFTMHGEVLISVTRDCTADDPLRLKFSVRDTGIGIAKENLPALFTAFAQGDSSTARKYGGSGLGLAIVKRLVSLMQGEVAIESELNKGSTFSFTSLFELQPDPHIAVSWPDLAQVRVLIVDGNQTGRAVLRQMLSGRGATTSEAASYAAGLTAIQEAINAKRPPRIVLLDDRIPSPDVHDMEPLVAAASRCGAFIIMMIHCDNLANDISRLASLKLETYLAKPIDMNELAKVLRQVIVGDAAGAPQNQSSIASVGAELPIIDRPLNILFADDSSDNRMLIRAFLKMTPYHLDEVENGRQAIDGFIAGHYDLVLMDIQMPEVDGYAATRAIRDWERDHNRARTPIIALTASVFSESVRLTQAAGCDAHVGKPLKKATLLRAIYDAVGAAAGGNDDHGHHAHS